jgi:N-acetyl-alpha-D-muramate 1-phosphate uridylyltransferase
MKALILAAGLGERMRPLTETTPKPLLKAGGKPLIAWHLERLAAVGVREVVVNTSWLAPRFPEALGDGDRWGLRIRWSYEGPTPLETGGGMHHALPLLAEGEASDAAFLAINGDIWTDIDLAALCASPVAEAHLVLVGNPPHNAAGDFTLDAAGRVGSGTGDRLTFAGVGLYRPRLFARWQEAIGAAPGADATPPRFRLAPLLRAAILRGTVSGSRHAGRWTDVGTPARLAALDAELS